MGQVEWIRTNGGYIDTGYILNTNTRVELSYKTADNIASTCALFGCRTSTSSSDRFVLWHISNTQYRADVGNKNATISKNPNGEHIVSLTASASSSFLYDGVSSSVGNSSGVSNPSRSLYISNVNTNGSADSRTADITIYYCKIYEGIILKKDYVPYLKDGIYGIYDKISKTFYQSKTSNFTGGKEVDKLHMSAKVKGEWKEIKQGWAHVKGEWKEITEIDKKKVGEWHT